MSVDMVLFLFTVLLGSIVGWYYCWRTEVLPRAMVIMQYKNFIRDNTLGILWERYQDKGEGL